MNSLRVSRAFRFQLFCSLLPADSLTEIQSSSQPSSPRPLAWREVGTWTARIVSSFGCMSQRPDSSRKSMKPVCDMQCTMRLTSASMVE